MSFTTSKNGNGIMVLTFLGFVAHKTQRFTLNLKYN
jgi:hypothetical protein